MLSGSPITTALMRRCAITAATQRGIEQPASVSLRDIGRDLGRLAVAPEELEAQKEQPPPDDASAEGDASEGALWSAVGAIVTALGEQAANHRPQLLIVTGERAPVDALQPRFLEQTGDEMKARQQAHRLVGLRRLHGDAGGLAAGGALQRDVLGGLADRRGGHGRQS